MNAVPVAKNKNNLNILENIFITIRVQNTVILNNWQIPWIRVLREKLIAAWSQEIPHLSYNPKFIIMLQVCAAAIPYSEPDYSVPAPTQFPWDPP
jgi:hypothetical protein